MLSFSFRIYREEKRGSDTGIFLSIWARIKEVDMAHVFINEKMDGSTDISDMTSNFPQIAK